MQSQNSASSGWVAYSQWIGILALLCLGVIFGTWLGTRILEYVNEVWFVRVYRLVLTAVAISLAAEFIPVLLRL